MKLKKHFLGRNMRTKMRMHWKSSVRQRQYWRNLIQMERFQALSSCKGSERNCLKKKMLRSSQSSSVVISQEKYLNQRKSICKNSKGSSQRNIRSERKHRWNKDRSLYVDRWSWKKLKRWANSRKRNRLEILRPCFYRLFDDFFPSGSEVIRRHWGRS